MVKNSDLTKAKMQAPYRYMVSYTAKRLNAFGADGSKKFRTPVTLNLSKLYVVLIDEKIVYVGATTQSMASRLRGGWNEVSVNGYRGHRWRNVGNAATLDVWARTDGSLTGRDMETIEAEVVYLVRNRTGKWPEHQTEIHFYQSTDQHRAES